MKRMQYSIMYASGVWVFSRGSQVLETDTNKKRLVTSAASRLDEAYIGLALRSELTIYGRNGRIQDKRTYGQDPRRSPG